MTQARLRRIVSTWQNRLGLDRWRLTLYFEDHDCENKADASTRPEHHSDDAPIWFYNWTKWTRTYANEVVVHELLHIAHRDITHFLRLVEPQLSRDVYRIADIALIDAIERFIDHQARVLVKLGGEV